MKQSLLGKFFGSPLLWGGLLSVLFYWPLHTGYFSHPLLLRYFTGHEVEYITTVMFFVGIAALGMKYLWVRNQRRRMQFRPIFPEFARHGMPGHKVDARYAGKFLEELARHEKEHGKSILAGRIRLALQFVRRSGSAEELDNELRYLSETDGAKADSDYGLVRLILWAVPMLGFLGTVIGITIALGNLDLNAINESSKMLSSGLMVAFDTTALAIALDLALYFVQFIVYREESNLLWEVDKLVDAELRGRFEQSISSEDNKQVLALRRMLEDVALSLEKMMSRQAAIWEQSLTQITTQNSELLRSTLIQALNENVQQHAKNLGETSLRFSEVLQKNVAGLKLLQEETVKQTETVRDLLGTGTQLAKLEERLNRNLSSLAQVGNFEETVNSLAAVIHLLNGKHRFSVTEKDSAA